MCGYAIGQGRKCVADLSCMMSCCEKLGHVMLSVCLM